MKIQKLPSPLILRTAQKINFRSSTPNHASERVVPGFENLGRHHQKFEEWVTVVQQKR